MSAFTIKKKGDPSLVETEEVRRRAVDEIVDRVTGKVPGIAQAVAKASGGRSQVVAFKTPEGMTVTLQMSQRSAAAVQAFRREAAK